MVTKLPSRPSRFPSATDLAALLTPARVRRYPVALLVVTASVYLVGIVRSSDWIDPNGKVIGHDFLAFYMAGDMINRGRLNDLYDVLAQQEYQQQFMHGINPRWSGTCLYLNPPHYAWVMSLPARLGYGPSLLIWWVLSALCFVATAWIWCRWIEPKQRATAVLLAICMPAWFWAIAGGQNTFFSLLILTGFCHLLIAGRDGKAGLVLSLLAFKFQLLIIPAGLLVYKRRWRAVGGLSLGGVVTLLLTVCLLGPQSLRDYLAFGSQLGQLMQCEGFDVHKQHSWYGFFALAGIGMLPAVSVRILAATASLATLVVLGSIWRGEWARCSPRFALQLGALVIATLLTSPHLFHYDMLLATLPAMLWLRAARDPSVTASSPRVRALLAAGFFWLALSSVVAGALHVQLTPILLMAWLVIVRGAAVNDAASASGRLKSQSHLARTERPTDSEYLGRAAPGV